MFVGAPDENLSDSLEILITKVQAHPMLWNRSNSDYKRADKKRKVWNAIAQKLGMEGICITIKIIYTIFQNSNSCQFVTKIRNARTPFQC